MHYETYSAEFKIAMVNEYMSRDISIRDFAKEKNIKPSTFGTWIAILRKNNEFNLVKRTKKTKSLVPIEVTKEAKSIIIKEKENKPSNTFILETNGITLTFSIDNLKDVLGAIRND